MVSYPISSKKLREAETDLVLANMDDTTPIEKQTCSVHTVVRPLAAFPAGFEALARGKSPKITPVRAERVVLNNLLGKKDSSLLFIGYVRTLFLQLLSIASTQMSLSVTNSAVLRWMCCFID